MFLYKLEILEIAREVLRDPRFTFLNMKNLIYYLYKYIEERHSDFTLKKELDDLEGRPFFENIYRDSSQWYAAIAELRRSGEIPKPATQLLI